MEHLQDSMEHRSFMELQVGPGTRRFAHLTFASVHMVLARQAQIWEGDAASAGSQGLARRTSNGSTSRQQQACRVW
jgi:hypothetical protein